MLTAPDHLLLRIQGAPWERGNCLFLGWPQPKGLNPIAINSRMWDSARMCGACIAITNEFGTHLAVVTDQSAVKQNLILCLRRIKSDGG
ncbi:hypothetical protein PTTG_12620 [Puccinia triticina 1-1 BBBD Race 1]|uniref:Uncharacterized protein n=1 Tax=Puccinia triticina (isolate 1-1 / race 1 (BBBD)) TaxID=630390 RepID=A0A180GIY1_PUCT1|nr:hypothetical protein PTTG_12620 [Puccinia triticina 1-1 BBBD Race 1]